jgi:hypothetical protein
MPIIAGRASAAYGAGFGKLLSAGGVFAPVSAFDALSTVVVPSGGLTSITFAGIPQTGYEHLQIRATHLYTGSGANMIASFNNGSFVNSRSHFIYGEGSTATGSQDTAGPIISFQSGTTSTAFCAGVWDFLDYTNSSKNKTMRCLVGQDKNGSGIIGFLSALAVNTSPINAITFSYAGGASFIENTQFSLYGVK